MQRSSSLPCLLREVRRGEGQRNSQIGDDPAFCPVSHPPWRQGSSWMGEPEVWQAGMWRHSRVERAGTQLRLEVKQKSFRERELCTCKVPMPGAGAVIAARGPDIAFVVAQRIQYRDPACT